MQIRPLQDRVVIEPNPKEEKSAGGILLAGDAQEKPSEGKVVAVGPGKILENGSVHKCQVKVGDKVLYGKYSGTEVKLAGKPVLIMREEELFGVIEA
jgi:chaperonin GroES